MIAAAYLMLGTTAVGAAELDANALLNADQNPNDWVMYHQSYKSWHFSPLDQINASNVKHLKVVWMHDPGASPHGGVQSFPLAIDGRIYYTAANNEIWALDGATGAFLWKYQPKIDEDWANTISTVYNRGLAAAYGNLYMGTVDGHLIAVDMKTGKPVWNTKLLSLSKGIKGITGAPLVVKDKVIIGSTGGERSGCCGPIFAVDAHTGQKVWEFDTIGGDDRSRASWGNDSLKIGGGGGWMTGTYDQNTDTIFWGTSNPAPDYDNGERPGDNLYTSGVIALDPNTGKLKSYFQEVPHDSWDFDGAVGEMVMIDRDGQHYLTHPNKGGYVYVYNRDVSEMPLKIENVWHLGETSNFVDGVDPHTGKLIGRHDITVGKHDNVCPAIDGAISWNAGSYDPDTGLYYKVGQEWCENMEAVHIPKPPDYSGRDYISATYSPIPPRGHDAAYGHVNAVDPISGKKAWEVIYKYPPMASLLSTKGGLVFVPGADGMLDALDAKTGQKLWSQNDGIGHDGGIISYAVHGKQYIAVTTGWGTWVSQNLATLFGQPFKSMPMDGGALIVYGLSAD
ncbi:MAG: PQQ-binding-like beta-propeller repeat protein [Pseudomonadota bacterium]|nr:PQQ-binding-like beta-propeller repeat protein [Pseudomonadota bacterium]